MTGKNYFVNVFAQCLPRNYSRSNDIILKTSELRIESACETTQRLHHRTSRKAYQDKIFLNGSSC